MLRQEIGIFFPLTLIISVFPGLIEKSVSCNCDGVWGQWGCQAVQGIRRSLGKQVVYLYLLKREKALLSLSCEVKNVLCSLEAINEAFCLFPCLYSFLLPFYALFLA